MFGDILRAAGQGALMVLFAAILGELLGEIVPLFNAPNSMLAQTFNAVSDWALTIGLLSALALVIARAVTQSEVTR